jgi:hypothetical protein
VGLASGDTGMKDISAVTAVTENATAGEFYIASDTTGVIFGTYTVGGAWVDSTNEVTDTGKKIYKSTNAGNTWTDISDATGLSITNTQFVACAPDNPDLLMVVDGTSGATSAYVSDDGGIEFSDVSLPSTVQTVTDLDVSAAASGIHYAAISGINSSTGGDVWYYKLGIGGSWTTTNTLAGFNTSATTGSRVVDTCLACAFSPNFASDQVLTVVSANNSTSNKAVWFEMLSVSTTSAVSTWNTAANFLNYPVVIENSSGANITDAAGASIALAPTYLGSDEIERIAIVGLRCTAATDAGVYRLKDYVSKSIWDERQIYSVAYDGVTAVAGETDCTVWRSDDPMSTIPTFYPTASTKAPGGASNPVLAWADTTVVAATAGNESCFSVSVDDGKSFNDISLIDTSIATIEDIAVLADGSLVYMTTDDGFDLSVWRGLGLSWQRVLSSTAETGYLIRLAPDDPDVIYIAEKGGKGVYFSKEGGDTKWYSRRSTFNVQDMAVESKDVAYIAKASSDAVIKTTNSGFTWGAAEDTELIAGNIYTIKSLSEDNLIVGSTAGYVSYSTDGNDSWDEIVVPISATATNVQVTASGLTEDDYIYVAVTPAASTGVVYHWDIGQLITDPWKALYDGHTNGATGVAYADGWLYVLASSSTAGTFKKTSMPWYPDPGGWMWSTAANSAAFTNTPSALRVSSSETATKVWAASAGALYSYEDTLSPVAPSIIGPADGTKIKLNPITGYAYDIDFTWNRLPKTSLYDLWIAYDPGMMETAVMVQGGVAPLPTSSFIIGPSGGAGELNYMPGTTYYWWLRVADGGPLHSNWSEVRSFTVEAGTALAPTVGSPENGSEITTVNPAFSWSPVSGATMYEFQLAVSTNFAAALHSEKLAETGIRPTVKLEQGMTYFWRVRAVEPIVGDWSTIANFTVAEPEEAAPPPVQVTTTPPPEIKVEMPAPEPVPDVILQPPAEEQIAPGYIWAVIIIGAILVIAVIVLIVRTRRSV